MAKARVKTEARPSVPQNRDQTVEAIAEFGVLQRQITRAEASMNDELAGIKERYEEANAPLQDRMKALHAGVQTWCEANREHLTDGLKIKTVTLGSGEVRWRLPPPSIKPIRGKGVLEKVLARLRKMGLERFIRVSEEINKEAILADIAAVRTIPEIVIAQEETFEIVPFEVALEVQQ